MSDGASLLAYCHLHPDDDQARLVYADWLEEHGEADRAELVRVQVARSRLWEGDIDAGLLEEREQHLLKTHLAAWLAPLPLDIDDLVRLRFSRGLPTRLSLTARQFLTKGKSLRQKTHVDAVS